MNDQSLAEEVRRAEEAVRLPAYRLKQMPSCTATSEVHVRAELLKRLIQTVEMIKFGGTSLTRKEKGNTFQKLL